MKRSFGWALLLCALAWGHARAQEQIRVALLVGGQSDGGRVSRAFGSALRELPNVRVVGAEEPYNFLLQVAVLCDATDCQRAGALIMAVHLSSPLQLARMPAELLNGADNDQLRIRLADLLANATARRWGAQYTFQHDFSLIKTASSLSEQSIREHVEKLDGQCFELRRLGSKRALTADPESVAALERSVKQAGNGMGCY